MNNPNNGVESIFEAALALKTDAERAEFLDRACPDSDLRREVESLLEAHRHPDDVFEEKTIVLQLPITEVPGTRIGRYKLLQQIGEGGMGVVYMAEQEEPVRRRVALKIIKLGMDTRQVVARFEAERQALAMMDHPNIARVLDGGATETGRPYFVMELVHGVPITEYCDQNKLPARERLKLFIQVCQAIQSAHQKAIIHRDIKPSNVLVTLHNGEPTPKVIDFGIAKATSQKLTEKTLFTNFGTMIGTPAYMSPEQAQMGGLDIDTRSDLYSLGVLLYELLTGSTPFSEKRLRSLAFAEMQRVIREEEPERPSTRLSTLDNEHRTAVVKNHSEELGALRNLLKGDLDWIVMKCLEKDRGRRYETASGVAADLKRHLNNEPVLARPPSAAYRFQKMVRRNKLAVGAGSAIAAALALGMVVSTWLFIREREAHRQTLAAEKTAKTQADQLVEALRLWRAGDSDDLSRAEGFFRQTVETQKKILGEESLEVAATLRDLSGVLEQEGKAGEAESTQSQSVAIKRKVLGKDHPDLAGALFNFGMLLQRQHKLPKAEAALREGLLILRRGSEVSSRQGLFLHHLADVLREEKSLAEARSMAQEAVTLYQRNAEWPANEKLHAGQVLGLVMADFRDNFGPSLKVGDPAPPMDAGKWVQGEPVKKLEKGTAYLVEFWATWCVPCRASIPHLTELQAKFGHRGLTVIGQDCLEPQDSHVEPFVKTMGDKMVYPVALDDKVQNPKGAMADSWLEAAGNDGIPNAFLIDKNGFIAWIGHPLRLEEAIIEDVLAEKFDLPKAAAEYAAAQKVKRGTGRALALLREGKLDQAELPLDEALTQTNQAGTGSIELLSLRADVRARRGEWQGAAADMARVVEAGPSDHSSWYMLAPMLVMAGDFAAYQKECHAMLARFGESDNPMIAERAAKGCLLHPAVLTTEELTTVAKLASRAVDTGQESQWLHWFELTKGLALYRQGDFAGASEWMLRIQKHIALANDSARDMCEADTYFVHAMARFRANEREAARAALDHGLQIVRNRLPQPEGGDLGGSWYDVAMTYIFMREAKELIGEPLTPKE